MMAVCDVALRCDTAFPWVSNCDVQPHCVQRTFISYVASVIGTRSSATRLMRDVAFLYGDYFIHVLLLFTSPVSPY